MAVVDAALIYLQDVDVASEVLSDVLDLGGSRTILNPLYFDVKLTTGNTSGGVTSVKVQSSEDEDFTEPVDEMEVFVNPDKDQTVPCELVQAFCPITPGQRYIRLVVNADGSGGKLWAYMTPDLQVPVL